ncbi:MAG: CheR family methyltransferase [Desulfovermiculus sp.]
MNQDEKPVEQADSGELARGFPVIGLGASAGGLEALKAFFSQVPEDSGMAFIVMMHLAPDQPSMLPELLQKVSAVPVSMASDGQSLVPDRVYIVPPRTEISIYKNVIQLLAPVDKAFSLPIDFFFRTLAADRKSRAAAVILSGTGSDGSVGLKEIKDHEGLVLAQSEESAKHDGMPGSARSTGLVDMTLDPEQMPRKLVSYFKQPVQAGAKKADDGPQGDWLQKIFALLRVQAGHDFSFYKTNTIQRRISRRMLLNQIEEYETYLAFLRQDPHELNALFQELLIGVTNFFRDPKSFESLKNEVLPKALAELQDDACFKVWVPGCSTGEEAYSLAITILECLDAFPGKRVCLQIFGTDIDKKAIAKAREGLYSASIQADVSQERLERFFSRQGNAYRIRKEVRDAIIFSVQDVLKDPPFSRLNLLSCRNLLIYLNTEAQKRLLPLFHYTLVPGGILMLGSSETIGGFNNLFKPLNYTWKIYKRRDVPQHLLDRVEFPTGRQEAAPVKNSQIRSTHEAKANLEQVTRNLLLERFAPAAAVIDSQGSIQYIQGKTGKYLELSSGMPTQNILDMARQGLRVELSIAMRKAVASNKETIRRRVRVLGSAGEQAINLYVVPLDMYKALIGSFLVVFQDVEFQARGTGEQPGEQPGEQQGGREADSSEQFKTRVAELEQELQETRESHQSVVEELESSNEELKSTNEELQSSNEELQSTNEELESSKEELQSLNEELQTVNSELQSKVQELSEARDDINNLLSSTEIAIVFVDNNLKIKRFSQQAAGIISLIDSDVGRPLAHQSTQIQDVDLIQDVRQVLDSLMPVEKEIRTVQDKWYILRIMPYRTTENSIQGAVITFRDINEQKKAQEELKQANIQLEQAWYLTRRVFDMHPNPLLVLDEEKHAVIANPALESLLHKSAREIEGRDVFDLLPGVQDTDLDSRLEAALQRGQDFESREFHLKTRQGENTYFVQGSIVRQEREQRPYRILLTLQRPENA